MVPLFLLILLIYFLFLSFFIYVLICGNNKFHRDGFIGKVYYLMMVKLPAKLNSCATKFIPKKYANNTNATSCMGKGGPCRYFIAIFYMCIYAFFVGVYVYYIHPQVPRLYPNHVQLHRILTFLVLPWPWIIFITFQFMDPGEITPTNVLSYMKEYPYDNAIHPEGRVCRTLHIPIVARSRYCQYTNRRVANFLTHSRYDHYCPWVLASIGERTHRFFLLFLLSDIIASSYYCWGSYKYLKLIITFASSRIPWTESKMNNWILVFLILLRAAPLVVSIFILLFVIAIALIFFLAQQMYFVSINKTQVELEKYDYLTELRREKGDYTPVVNIYDKGIIGNWKELLFPTRKAEHERVYIPPEDVNEDGFLKKKQNKKNENDNKRISVKNPKLAKKHK